MLNFAKVCTIVSVSGQGISVGERKKKNSKIVQGDGTRTSIM